MCINFLLNFPYGVQNSHTLLFLAMSCGAWDLSSLTSIQTHAPCIRSEDSSTGAPGKCLLILFLKRQLCCVYRNLHWQPFSSAGPSVVPATVFQNYNNTGNECQLILFIALMSSFRLRTEEWGLRFSTQK